MAKKREASPMAPPEKAMDTVSIQARRSLEPLVDRRGKPVIVPATGKQKTGLVYSPGDMVELTCASCGDIQVQGTTQDEVVLRKNQPSCPQCNPEAAAHFQSLGLRLAQ